MPSGIAANDQVPVTFYPAQGADGRPAPAVVLVHALGESTDGMMRRVSKYLSAHGICAAAFVLPYHMSRQPRGLNPVTRFVPRDVSLGVQAFRQSAADVSEVVTWLQSRPEVDGSRIGIMGVSLGAIVTHLAMGLDERLTVGVAVLGGGNLAHIYAGTAVSAVYYPFSRRRLSPAEQELVRTADPLTYADRNRPRRVLMIQAARDILVPPSDGEALRRALGNPPTIWLDTNHYGPIFAERDILRAANAYFHWAWQEPPAGMGNEPPEPFRPPSVDAPTIKFGFIFGLQSAATPAAMLQIVHLGIRRDHMRLLHLDAGLSGRGPFVALGLTLNAHLDAGIARRVGPGVLRPYVSLHLAL